jgi:hypothetical protein
MVGRTKARFIQLDGKLPNLALMAAAAHHRTLGHDVEFAFVGTESAASKEPDAEFTYASLIFEKTRPVAEALKNRLPRALIGGTGWDVTGKLEDHGIRTDRLDYTLYPAYEFSVGFTQRGCRLKCGFCVVPRKEGAVKESQTIAEIYRGEPWPRKLVLLDNDFFGQPRWAARIQEIQDGKFKVNFCQGINARMLNDESAAAIASVPYYDSKFERRQVYTAWDARSDERRLFAGLDALAKHGVRPRNIMVYVLVGYDHRTGGPRTLHEDDLYRQARLREWGAVPYPMPFHRSKDLTGFQRWCVGAYDKRVPWAEWVKAGYRPERLGWEQVDGKWTHETKCSNTKSMVQDAASSLGGSEPVSGQNTGSTPSS